MIEQEKKVYKKYLGATVLFISSFIISQLLLINFFKKNSNVSYYQDMARRLSSLKASGTELLDIMIAEDNVTWEPSEIGINFTSVIENLKQTKKGKILLVGNSQLLVTRDNWSSTRSFFRIDQVLKRKLNDQFEVYNFGFGGATLPEIEEIAKRALEYHFFDYVIVAVSQYCSFQDLIRLGISEMPKTLKLKEKKIKEEQKSIDQILISFEQNNKKFVKIFLENIKGVIPIIDWRTPLYLWFPDFFSSQSSTSFIGKIWKFLNQYNQGLYIPWFSIPLEVLSISPKQEIDLNVNIFDFIMGFLTKIDCFKFPYTYEALYVGSVTMPMQEIYDQKQQIKSIDHLTKLINSLGELKKNTAPKSQIYLLNMPIRQDSVNPPYLPLDFRDKFKRKMKTLSEKNNILFFDAEEILDLSYYGIHDHLRQHDILHFTGRGHETLADFLIENIGFKIK